MVAVTAWRSLHGTPILHDGEVHLYRLSLDGAVNQYRTILSDDEIARAERLLDSRKQQFFVACRGQLRQVLARYLDISAQNIVFEYNASGKPSLALSHLLDLTFNLSHSGNLAVIMVTRRAAVGVDIETIDFSLEFHKLAERFFDQQELKVLKQTSIVRQRRMFYRLWTAKEACLKMAGTGFSQSQLKRSSPEIQCHFFASPHFIATIACSTKITAITKYDALDKTN